MKKEQTAFQSPSWNFFLEETIIQEQGIGYCGEVIPTFDGNQLHCEDTSTQLLEL